MKVFGNHVVLVPTIVFPLTASSTYLVAVLSKHVAPIWPYISHTGDYPIESCIFALGFNTIAGFYLLITILRYSQIEQYYKNLEPPHRKRIKKINIASLPFGLTASIFLSMAASIQLHVSKMHTIAAAICSWAALIYFWLQTVISFKIPSYQGNRALLRLALSITSTTMHFLIPITWFLLHVYYPRTHEEALWWSPDKPGFSLYISGAIMEWFFFISNATYIASFYTEFKSIQIRKDEVVFL